jgi:D-alanyl-lipoteichoic acid acyltransferase DltB (MBOAT superfamily)
MSVNDFMKRTRNEQKIYSIRFTDLLEWILEIPKFSVGPTAMLSKLKPRLENTVAIRVKTPDSL